MALVAVGPCVPPCALGAQACVPGTAAVTDRAGERGAKERGAKQGAKKMVLVLLLLLLLLVLVLLVQY